MLDEDRGVVCLFDLSYEGPEEETGRVLLVELWETAQHQQAYLNWRMETGLVDALSQFLAGELQPRTFSIREDV